MRTLILASALFFGCASSTPPGETTPPTGESASDQEVSHLQARAREQADELRELRSRVALAEAEAEGLRNRSSPTRSETVRISTPPREGGLRFFEDDGGGWDAPTENETEEREPTPAPQPEARRPVLRLHGTADRDPMALSSIPLRAPGLPSASLPPNPLTAPGAVLPVMATPTWTPPVARPAVSPQGSVGYRAALGSLRSRNFDQALAGFDSFLQRNPSHSLAPNARYWRAEVLYIQRRYAEAIGAFREYLHAHATGAKAPDALYKLALCRRQIGDDAGARRTLQQLRRQHPNSVAARTAREAT